MTHKPPQSRHILLVEDSPSDARLIISYIQRTNRTSHFSWVQDGETAIEYLQQQGEQAQAPRPDLILLDLNLPQMSGHQVLDQIKTDAHLQQIPVLILTSSDSANDITQAYTLHANSYLIKPTEPEGFSRLTRAIDDFWFHAVQLPS
jgi:two-component system, chemotaxis family, response regulator Rcp1